MSEQTSRRARSTGALWGTGHFLPRVLVAATAINLTLVTPLLAIPSPDVVLSFFASAGQVLGLLTALLGSVVFVGRRRLRASGSATGRLGALSRWPFAVVLILLLVSVGANVLQYARGLDQRNQRLRRNLVRSSTENGQQVVDAALITLDYSEQLDHPRGMSTDELARRLGAHDQRLHLIDVREPEEREMGHIAGSRHLRYPDLRLNAAAARVEGKQTVLLCFSGNRSSELCDTLAKAGSLCYFLVGGYEQWIAEDRPLVLPPSGRSDKLRDLPGYPNKEVLLDTPQVERLVEEEHAIFVDVRYKREFDAGHLPGAIHLPIRGLPTPQMWEELRALPRKPIVAACYDKRSSYYSLILGLRLHREGYDFRGRYTVPHEYYVVPATRAHVSRWLAAHNRSLLDVATTPLRRLLDGLLGLLGHLALAILAGVLMLRLVTLPLTLKAERDQIVLRGLAPRISEIKQTAGGDRQRYSRSVLALYRRHRITSGLNLLAAVLQIGLFLLFFAAVNRVAEGSQDAFLWIPALSNPDPLLILPGLLMALIFVHLQLNAVRHGRLYLSLRVLAAVFLFAITFQLRAALNLYLLANVALMVSQNRLLDHLLERRRRGQGNPRRLATRGVVPLRLAHRIAGTGNKAIRLAQMMEAGAPVPDGFVVTHSVLSRSWNGVQISSAERRTINALWKNLGAEKVAVRSSGLNEDGGDRSYAGVFESILNVRRDAFGEALEEVRNSLNSSRANAYTNNAVESGGILVQEMVDAEYAGVLFTEHPGESGSSLVEMVPGLGDALVSGLATPKAYRVGALSGRLLSDEEPPIDLTPLLELGRRMERLFGKPQDVEWAYSRGRFFLLQSRHITRLSRSTSSASGAPKVFEAERHRLLQLASEAEPDEVVFAQNELSELLPRPTPFSLSLMQSLWAPGGSTDRACRALGFPYAVTEDSAPYLTTVFGALYVHRREERRRTCRGPGMVSSFLLARRADALESEFREKFLPRYRREIRLREVIDLSRLSRGELLDLFEEWRRRFVEETYVQAEQINIAAGFYFKLAERELTRRGLPAANYLSHPPKTVVHRAMSLLPAVRAGKRPVSEFLEAFGHRAPQDYELAEPRYREDNEQVKALIARAGSDPREAGAAEKPTPPKDPLLALALDRACRFQALKEEAKHECLRELALLRSLLLEIGRKHELGDDVFFVTAEEIPRLSDSSYWEEASSVTAERRAARELFHRYQLPTELTVAQLESLTPDGRIRETAPDGPPATATMLRGTLVAGDREVIGNARVIRTAEEIDAFQDGEILVARFTDPSWTPLFPKSSGIITEVGGWLSHAAIVAREYNVTTTVGVKGALNHIRTGDRVKLLLDGSIRYLEERRAYKRRRVDARIALLRQGEILEAMLLNLSRTGALVNLTEDLSPGQAVTVRIAQEGAGEIDAEVIRRDSAGGFALRFSSPLAPELSA